MIKYAATAATARDGQSGPESRLIAPSITTVSDM